MKSAFPVFASIAVTAVLAGGCVAVDRQRAATDPSAWPMPKYQGHVTIAGGTYKHDIDGATEDDAAAGLIAAQGEICAPSGLGGGAALEFMSSNDHLMAGQTSTSHAESIDAFPYLLYRAGAGETFRMPVRIGPWIHALTLDDQGSTDRLQWVTLGLRLAVEPEIVLERTEGFEWTVFAGASLAAGITRIGLDSTTGNEDFDSHATGVGLEVGPRFRWSNLCASISFLHRGVTLDESDPSNGQTVSEVGSTFNGLALTIGGSY